MAWNPTPIWQHTDTADGTVSVTRLAEVDDNENVAELIIEPAGAAGPVAVRLTQRALTSLHSALHRAGYREH